MNSDDKLTKSERKVRARQTVAPDLGDAISGSPVEPPRRRSEVARKINQAVGRRVRAIRTSCGHSQDHVAEVLGLSFQQIQKFESGSSRISPDKLLQIARYYGMPIAWFFEDVPADLLPTADAAEGGASGATLSHYRLRLEVGRELQYTEESLLRPLLKLLKTSRRKSADLTDQDPA